MTTIPNGILNGSGEKYVIHYIMAKDESYGYQLMAIICY